MNGFAPCRRGSSDAHRVALGLLMLSRGELTHAQFQAALEAQRRRGQGRIGECVVELGFAQEQQITAVLAAQWSCPVLRNFPERLPPYAVPLPLLRHFQMAPAHYSASTKVMHVAFARSIEYHALHAIEEVTQCRADPCVTSASALAEILARIEDKDRRCEHVFADAPGPEEMTRISVSYATRLRIEDIRLARCGDYIWVRLKAGTDSLNLLFDHRAAETAAVARNFIRSPKLTSVDDCEVRPRPLTPEAASPFPNAG